MILIPITHKESVKFKLGDFYGFIFVILAK